MVNPISTSTLLQRYQRLIEIAQDIASTLDLDTLLGRIVRAAADLSEAEEASILLYEQSSQQLHFEAATNMENSAMRGIVVPGESSLAGWIVTNRQPLILSQVQNDPRHFASIEKSLDVKTRSMLGVPLITKNKVVGVLEAINKKGGEFTTEDQEILSALGAQAAIAIQNTRLFQQSDLISELIHELGTPLSSLSTAARLLLRPEVSEEQRARMVEIIQDETFRLSEMTTSYLDLARLESGRAQFKPEQFDLKDLLVDCENVMHGRIVEKGLKVCMELPGTPVKVKADRNKIKQVAINLLSNAIKYNRSSGSITVGAASNGKEVRFWVRDTGPGIRPENLQNLFQKFYRVPGSENLAPGTGLGLSICKQIIEAHRGHIEVQSEVGVGTTFTAHLPVKSMMA